MALWWILVVVALALVVPPVRRWLASMSGAIWILAVLAVLSLLGVLVGQNLPPEAYVQRYGAGVARFLTGSGITDIFGAWYFLLFVAILAVSLLACSAGRLLRAAAGGKRKTARVGLLLAHVSLVVILAGGLVTGLFGFRYPAASYLGAGDELFVEEGGFTVRVDRASTEFTDSGMVSEYFTDAVVIEDGREVLSHRVEVNSPLVYRGIGLYQHEMLPSATSVTAAVIGVRVMTPQGEGPLFRILAQWGEEEEIPGTDVTVKVLEFLSDFTYDIERRTAELASIRHRNPAVLVQIAEAGSVVDDMWLFADSPAHQRDLGIPCRLFLFDYIPDFERGLSRFEISHQPGTPLLFTGFLAMSVGLALMFWTRPSARGRDGETEEDGRSERG